MIKRLLLPHRPRSSPRPVQAMRGRRFNPLHNLNQAVKTAIHITKRSKQKMDMVRHDDGCMNRRLRPLIMQTVPQHDIAYRFRQWIETAAAKCDKHHSIVLLIVRQPPPILVLSLKRCVSHLCRAGALARRFCFCLWSVCPKRSNRSVTWTQPKCDDFNRQEGPRVFRSLSVERAPPPAAFDSISLRQKIKSISDKRHNQNVTISNSREGPQRIFSFGPFAGGGARATRVWESRSLPA
jgi:hypothetical protein